MLIISKTITIRIGEDLHKKFKMFAVKQEKDMTQILIEHIKFLLKEDEITDGNKQKE